MRLTKTATLLIGALGLVPVTYADNLFVFDSTLSGWALPSSLSVDPSTVTQHSVTVTDQTVSLDLGGSAFAVTPAAGTFLVALNPFGTSSVGGYSGLDSALGLAANTSYSALSGAGGNDTLTNVAILSKNVTLNTGTSYSFYWAYAAQDYYPFKDGVFFSYSKDGSGVLKILARNGDSASAPPSISPGLPGYPSGTIMLPSYGSTAWNKFAFTVPSSGIYKVSFGAFNNGDYGVDPIFFLADAKGSILGQVFLIGPSADDTLASMQRNVDGFRKIFSLQAAYLNPGLSYDCSVFDKHGVCVSFSGRYTGTSGNGPEVASGVLTAAYRINPNIRLGGFIEQYASDYSSGGVEVKSRNPDFGIFGVWSQTGTDEGVKVRAAYRYGKRDLSITRDAIDSAEAGTGTSKLVTEGAQLTASYGYSLSNTVLASPYLGVRYTSIGRNGYTESASETVTTPLQFDTLRQETTSLLAGVNLWALVAPSVTVNGSVGVETDTERKVGRYSATGVADLASIDFNGDTRKTRMVGSVGVTYKIDNTQQIGAHAWYREEAYGSTATTTGMITYTAGF